MDSQLHMAYGEIEPNTNRSRNRRLTFKNFGDSEELLVKCLPAVRKRVLRAREDRQRAAARSVPS